MKDVSIIARVWEKDLVFVLCFPLVSEVAIRKRST